MREPKRQRCSTITIASLEGGITQDNVKELGDHAALKLHQNADFWSTGEQAV
jgi:hypothetical protein